MTKKDFSIKELEASPNYWAMVLRGERNLGYSKACKISVKFGTDVNMWIDPECDPEKRKEAWDLWKLKY